MHGESTPYILPTVPDVVLTQLQDGVLHSMELLQKEALATTENLSTMISPIFLQLLYFSKLACEAPSYGKIPTKQIAQVRSLSVSSFSSFKTKIQLIFLKNHNNNENNVIFGFRLTGLL